MKRGSFRLSLLPKMRTTRQALNVCVDALLAAERVVRASNASGPTANGSAIQVR